GSQACSLRARTRSNPYNEDSPGRPPPACLTLARGGDKRGGPGLTVVAPALTHDDREVLRRKHYNATVASLKLLHPELMVMRIRPDFPIPPHKPGQYSTL